MVGMEVSHDKIGSHQIHANGREAVEHDPQAFFTIESSVDDQIAVLRFDHIGIEHLERAVRQGNLDAKKIRK
jgi:hypothetical protein